MNNEAEVSIRFKNYISGENKLEKYAQTLAKIKSVTDVLDTKTITSIDQSATEVKNINSETSKMSKNITTAFNYGVIRQFVSGLKSAVTELGNLTKKSSEYLENINLFQVAFDGAYQEAEKFINQMSEMYGLDESNLTKMVGIFRQLANAMNISTETGTKLSTLLTQMAVDISSLYNIDISRASSVLQSTMAGQTKPIRGATGADITEATLQTTLDTLGIEKYVSDLSYAEKRLLIIISLTDQLSESTNDFARTIESPANQIRILNEQWERLSRAVGNLFLPIVSEVLPYLNAILMTLTEIINLVASLFGYNKEDYDYFAGTADSVLELEENLGGATENAKKLKQGLRGFDKLNVITTPSSSSASSGAGTGIDPDIMNAFNDAFDEYNNKLTNVKMKATEIRDRIMEWLGFTKQINPLTGDISWTYGGIKTTLKNMWSWFTKLNPKAQILVGLVGALVTSKTISLLTKFVTLLGNTGLFKWVKNLLTPMKTLFSYMGTGVIAYKNLNQGISTAITSWRAQMGIIDKTTGKLNGLTGVLNGSKIALQGLVTAGVGLYAIHDSMESLSEEGANLYNVLGLVTGTFTTIASGVQIGAIFGPAGAVIGGVAGALVSLVEAMMSYKSEADLTIESIHEYTESLQEQYEAIDKSYSTQLAQHDGNLRLIDELNQIVDANGNVKQGYEDRATFILTVLNNAYGTELKIIDGKIEKYQDEIDVIEKLIKKKKEEIYMQKAEETYNLAMSERLETSKKLSEAEELLTERQKILNGIIESSRTKWEQLDDSTKKYYGSFENYNEQVNKNNTLYQTAKSAVQEAQEAYDEAEEALARNTRAIDTYNGFVTASVQSNSKDIEYYMGEIDRLYSETTDKVSYTLSDYVTLATQMRKKDLENAKEINGKITDDDIANANKRYDEITGMLLREKRYLENFNDEYVDAWYQLSKDSKDTFINKFTELPEDIQQKVVNEMYNKGYSISEELQKGINAKSPTISFKADTSKVSSSLNSFFQKNSSFFGAIGIKIPNISFHANGGLPPVGQLFVANERGPELVGQIGGQSFVANQNQMMDLLDKKIGNANGGVQNATFIIQVGDEEVARKTLKNLQDMAKSNGKPITIGG